MYDVCLVELPDFELLSCKCPKRDMCLEGHGACELSI